MLEAEAADRHDSERARRAARLRGAVASGRCPQPLHEAPPARVPSWSAAPLRVEDASLSRRLERLAVSFEGISATWIHDLRSGRYASWNADARFPAASLVKLGLAVASGRDDYDVAAMLRWSSNLAANRLLDRIGVARVNAALRRMGATRSTYTGRYRVGTGRRLEPPLISSRVTTARDVGRMLFWLQAHRRQAILGRLLQSEQFDDNVGILRPRNRAAQKHGWLSVVRHSAAIVYGQRGPRIVVVLTYAPALTRERAQTYGAAVMRAAGLAVRAPHGATGAGATGGHGRPGREGAPSAPNTRLGI